MYARMKIFFGIETTRMSLFILFPFPLSLTFPLHHSSAAADTAGAKSADPSTTSAASAAPATAEDEASAKAAEAAMKEKIERLSGHMFAVM